MRRHWLFFGTYLLAYTTFTWEQLPIVLGTGEPERPQYVHHHNRRVNFSIRGGFTSSFFLVSDLVLNGIVINEMQNSYKIGYFGSFFMWVNFKRHLLQPEFSYIINRCNITPEEPLPDDAPESSAPEIASTTSSIHSFEIPVVYGYNVIEEGPYGLAISGEPKTCYMWDKKGKVTSENFDQRDIKEELYLLNVSLTTDVAATISRIFFDSRYDIGLHGILRRISYRPIYDESTDEETTLTNRMRFYGRDSVLSLSLRVFF